MRRRNLKFLSIFSLLFLGTSLVSCDFPFQGEQAEYGLVYLANNGLFDHGNVSLSSSGNVKVGTIINITATPDTNYILDYLTLNDTKLENPTFEVVKGNNVVNAYFIEEGQEQPPIVTGNEPISMDLPEGEIVPGQGSVLKTNYTLVDAETYYKDIDFSASKDLLEESLRTLVSNHKLLSYGDSRYTMLYTEEAISAPGKILSFYDSKIYEPVWDQGKTYNREHVWCRSHLKIEGKNISTNNSTKGIGSDLHNLKPLTYSLNSSRGDDFFGNDEDSKNYFYPNYSGDVDYRGDVARICFYMALRYDKLTLTDNLSGDTSTSFGLLSRLLEWNKLDPVDEFELRRTNRVYEYQGNRNPFVDYPYTLADKLFG